MVEFCSGNLLDFPDDLAAGLNHPDLVICRNGFTYFNKEAILKVMAEFAGLEGSIGARGAREISFSLQLVTLQIIAGRRPAEQGILSFS